MASAETGSEETFSHSLSDASHVIYVPHPKSLGFLQNIFIKMCFEYLSEVSKENLGFFSFSKQSSPVSISFLNIFYWFIKANGTTYGHIHGL